VTRLISWFSGGAASAVATKLAIVNNKNIEVVNIEIIEEHPDNKRFLKDCEEWFGVPIKTIGNDKRNRSIYEVYRKTKYISGVYGAACTKQLKKDVRIKYEKPNDIQVFGFTVEEEHRLNRLIDSNNEVKFISPLIERGLTKQDCLAIVQDAGIELPEMYKLGFNNNNCLGCPKGGLGYWLMIKKHFPEMFEKMNNMEKLLGVKIGKYTKDGEVHRIQLHEIPSHIKMQDDSLDVQCGVFCLITQGEIND